MLKSTDQNDWPVVGKTTIDAGYSGDDAVTLDNNSGSSLAGLTVANSPYYGIVCYESELSVTNCIVRDNGAYGISNANSTLFAFVAGNKIYGNAYCGITSTTDSSSVEIIDNLIYANGTLSGNGITISAAEDPVTIRNNTIVGNGWYGISLSGADDATIINCIVWDNGSGSLASAYYDVTYSCIDGGYTGAGNTGSDPCFVDDVNDDYHLKKESPCVDKGDSSAVVDANEKDIDGNPREMGPEDPNDPNGHLVDMGGDEDYPHCDLQYDDWVTFGRPNCWMWDYQCDGDADGINSGVPYYYRVYTGDIALINQNWRKKMGDPTLNPCADIDHISSGAPYYYRVYIGDISKVIENWRKTDANLPGDCANRGCQRGALGGGSPGSELSSKELLNRLAEIWLDPEVRKAIDEDAWSEFLESLWEYQKPARR